MSDLVELSPMVADAYRSLVEAAPLGLDAEPELWIIVDAERNPFLVQDSRTEEYFVAAARSEYDLACAWWSFGDGPKNTPVPGRYAATTEPSLIVAIRSVPDKSVAGFIIFDSHGREVRTERVQ